MDGDKAREQHLLELAGHGIEALGRAMEGTITGPIILALFLGAFYPLWLPTLEADVGALTKTIKDAWVTGTLPGINVPNTLTEIQACFIEDINKLQAAGG